VVPLGSGWTYAAVSSGATGLHLVVWTFGADSLTRQVLYTKSGQGCATFGPTVPLTADLTVPGLMQDIGEPHPGIFATGQRVGVVWSDLPGADAYARQYVWFRSSPDSGETWAEAHQLDPAPGEVGYLTAKSVASTGLRVHVLSNLGYFGSSDGGDTWSDVMPERAGEAIAAEQGPASVVGVEATSAGNQLYHLRVP
jgi:hypothetical protein